MCIVEEVYSDFLQWCISLFVHSFMCSTDALNCTVNHAETLRLVIVFAPFKQSLLGLDTKNETEKSACLVSPVSFSVNIQRSKTAQVSEVDLKKEQTFTTFPNQFICRAVASQLWETFIVS